MFDIEDITKHLYIGGRIKHFTRGSLKGYFPKKEQENTELLFFCFVYNLVEDTEIFDDEPELQGGIIVSFEVKEWKEAYKVKLVIDKEKRFDFEFICKFSYSQLYKYVE